MYIYLCHLRIYNAHTHTLTDLTVILLLNLLLNKHEKLLTEKNIGYDRSRFVFLLMILCMLDLKESLV